MTPTSARPLDKVLNGGIAAAVAVIVLALVKHYLWADLPADLEGPLNIIILAAVSGLSSFALGWWTKIKPGELTPIDAVLIAAQPDAETQPIETLK